MSRNDASTTHGTATLSAPTQSDTSHPIPIRRASRNTGIAAVAIRNAFSRWALSKLAGTLPSPNAGEISTG